VPTVGDRIAQTVVALTLEPRTEQVFHADSYGYRPGRSAHHALAACRERCWKKDWVLDVDIRAFFDSLNHDLVVKAVQANITAEQRWVLLYVTRWLTAPLQLPDGTLQPRDRGTPQGSAVSPVLANLVLHYAFDAFLAREFPTVTFEWVAGDEVYGADPTLRATMRRHRLGFVLQVAANRRVPTHAGMLRVDQLPATLPDKLWQRYSAGPGSKGPRYYAWAWIALLPEDPNDTGEHHLLIRRNDTTGELAYLRCYSPTPVPLSTLVKVAGQRWRIEESFQAAKGLTGLDQHQVRRWRSWHRWTTLAMLAHTFLAVATAIEREHTPAPAELIDLTVNQFRHLFDALLLGAKHTIDTLLTWSRWRRRHQARARECHYRRHRQQQ
jgi:hypothetical protein